MRCWRWPCWNAWQNMEQGDRHIRESRPSNAINQGKIWFCPQCWKVVQHICKTIYISHIYIYIIFSWIDTFITAPSGRVHHKGKAGKNRVPWIRTVRSLVGWRSYAWDLRQWILTKTKKKNIYIYIYYSIFMFFEFDFLISLYRKIFLSDFDLFFWWRVLWFLNGFCPGRVRFSGQYKNHRS